MPRSTSWPRAGAGVVRIAVDTPRDCQALAEIRRRTTANLSVDLQENYRLAAEVAPLVDKIRYNPGHLYHHERNRPWQDKVRFLVDVAGEHDCALRVGVNCGSVDPAKTSLPSPLRERGRRCLGSPKRRGRRYSDPLRAMLESALEHCDLLDRLGFTRYCVSLKDSDPAKVVEVNRRFAAERPEVPLHLGVTEAGMPPEGILKTRWAFEQLLSQGIGDTIRVSLTVPAARKHEEVEAGRQILADLAAGRLLAAGQFGRGRIEHHQLSKLFPGGERGVCGVGPAGPRGHAIRRGVSDHDCRDGLSGERAGRDRPRRPGALVRAELREPQTRRHVAGGVFL